MDKKSIGVQDFVFFIVVVVVAYFIFSPKTTINSGNNFSALKDLPPATSSRQLLLMYFYADYCGYCKRIKPLVYKMADEFSDKYIFVPIDTTDRANRAISAEYKIRGVPSIFLVDNISGKKRKLKSYNNEAYFRKELKDF